MGTETVTQFRKCRESNILIDKPKEEHTKTKTLIKLTKIQLTPQKYKEP